MMGGGGGGESVQVKYPEWWKKAAIPTMKDLGGVYQGQADQPLHPLEEEGLQGIAGRARAGGQLTPAAMGNLQHIMGTGGMEQNVRGLAGNLVGGGFVNPAMAETQRIAMGGDVGRNPYLEQTYERASRPLLQQLQQDVNPAIDIGAASSGRLGSGMHALMRNRAGEQTGQALTDLSTNIYGGAYESDQGRRMGALGQLGGLGQQDVQNRMAGAGLYDTGSARMMQAAGMAPGLEAADYADLDRLYGVGQAYQNAPWMAGERYLRNVNAMPGIASGSSTSGASGQAGIAGGAAGGLGGLGIAGQMAGAGMSMSPWGMAGMAGLGALGGMFSDVRTKKDIRPVGITFSGTPLYSYRYREEFGGGPAQIGVLAQELAEDQPDAVVSGPDGLLRVLYEKVV